MAVSNNDTAALAKQIRHLEEEIRRLREENARLRNLEEINTNELLEKISTRYIDLYDNAPDMFFSVRPDGTVISVNLTGARHLGYKKEELVDQPVWKVVYEEDLPFVRSKIEQILKYKEVKGELEFRKIRKDGSILHVNERTKLVFDENGKIAEIRITCRDITEKKEAQTILQAQEEKYRTLTFNLNVGLYRSTADEEGSFLEINPAFIKMLGYSSKKKLLEKPVSSLYVNPDDRKALQKSLQNKGFVKNLEVQLKKKNGATFIASVSTVVSRDEHGKPLYYDGIVEDITERKHVENAVKESENKYRTLFNFSPNGILIENQKGIIIDVNPAFCKILGYNREELIGMEVKKLTHPESRKEIERNIQVILGGTPLRHIRKNVTKSGSIIYVQLSESLLELPDGTPGIMCIAEDITIRIKAEQALIESEQKYRLLIENQSDLVVKVDTEGRFLFVSPSYCDLFGKTEEELLGKYFIELVVEEDRKETLKKIKGLYSPPFKTYIEQKAHTRSGWRWIAWMKTAILDEKDKVKEIIGVGRDVTDRKLAEEALLKSEESYRGLFNSTTDAIYIQDREGRFIDVNEGAVKMYGYPRDHFIGKFPDLFSAPGKNDLELVKKYLEHAFKGIPQVFEFWGIDKNGRVFPKEVKLNKGSYFGKEVVVAFAEDITERKKAEIAVKESERRLSTLMGNLQGMAYRCRNDKDWTMEFVSNGCFDLTGYQASDLIFNNTVSFNDIIHPDDRKRIWNEVQDAVNSRKSFRLIYRITTAQDKMKWVLEQGIGVYAPDGKLIALEGFISNITEQKEAEEEVRKLSRSVEQSPTIIIITDLRGSIEYVNPQFTKATGYAAAEVIGKNPRILKSGNTPKETYKKLWSTLKSGKEWFGEFENKKKSGELYWESANIFPLKDESGKTTHYIGMKEDITERKKMEQELIDAKNKAEESDRLKSAFLANMSHEIRTPMNAILGFSQLLDEPGLDSMERNHYINLIQNSGNELMNLIDDIIDISKIEAGQMKILKTRYSLDQVLQELDTGFNEYLKTRQNMENLSLFYKKPANSKDLIINSDVDRFKQVFKNLLNNAIKFTEKGSITFGYKLVDKNGGKFVEFFVSDTGIGIPADKHEVIFESFTQVSESVTKLYGGTGLGLSITKKIVEILGGEIWVDSEPGKGSTFCFTLPLES